MTNNLRSWDRPLPFFFSVGTTRRKQSFISDCSGEVCFGDSVAVFPRSVTQLCRHSLERETTMYSCEMSQSGISSAETPAAGLSLMPTRPAIQRRSRIERLTNRSDRLSSNNNNNTPAPHPPHPKKQTKKQQPKTTTTKQKKKQIKQGWLLEF